MDFLEADYGEDSTIFRESAPIQTSISESEDNDIEIIYRDDASELEDEAVRSNPQRWTDDSEYGVQICTSPQESASDVDDEASSPKSRELSTIYECEEEVGDDQCHIRQTALNNDNDPPTISSTQRLKMTDKMISRFKQTSLNHENSPLFMNAMKGWTMTNRIIE